MKTFFVILFLVTFAVTASSQYSTDNLTEKNFKQSSIKSDILSDISSTHYKPEKCKDISFNVNLYLWALSLDGVTALPINNASIPQTPVTSVKMGFSDAVKYVKMAAMIEGAFRFKNYRFLYDVDYMKLEYNGKVPLESGFLSAKLTAKQFSGDFSLGYSIPTKNKNIFLTGYAGTRVTSLNNTLDLLYEEQNVFSANKSKTWFDPIIGADITLNLSKHWFSYLKGDVGGFGVSSKFTGSLLGGAGYKITEHFNTTLGIKYLYINYDKDYYLWKVNQYGLLISAGYMF
ncbi:MAG: hypothetical protein PHN88_08940 [Ignavibacteria bacterium]|nr:hypothetical protein [Ignavibacteria bacterium]